MLIQTDRWLRRTLLATAIALGGAPAVVYAQGAPEETPEEAPPEPAESADSEAQPAQPAPAQPAPAQPAQPAPAQPAPAQPVPAETPPPPPPPAPEAPPPAPAPEQPAAQEEPDDLVAMPTDAEAEEVFTGEEEVITVTGSLIERRELTTPAPLAVLDKTDLDAAGVASIGDILQNLPSQSNAINVQFNNGGDGSTRVSLRGLGAGRTLVLVNGRRHVPGGTGANSSVDLNAIPAAVIERVEVLKDGASAIYGSDAMGGVVNIITRTDFEGSEVSLYTGTTGDGLGQTFDVSVATGTRSEEGNVVFAAGFHDQQPIGAGERDFSRSDKFYDWETGEVFTSGSTAVPQGYIYDRTGAAGNESWQNVLTTQQDSEADPIFYNDPEEGWRPFDGRGNSDVGEGDLYNYQPENYLITPQQRYNVYSTGSYNFHEHVRGFFEASYTNRKSDQRLAPEPLFTIVEGIAVSADNYYNPFGRDFYDVRRRMIEAGPRKFLQDVSTFRLVTGVDGRIPDEVPFLQGWRWSLAYNFGRTDAESQNQGNLHLPRLTNALGPSFVDASGTPQCGTPDNPIEDCVPLNVFGGRGTITQDMLDYISYTGIDSGFNQQQVVSVSTTGKLFDTPWGGDVALAVGADYRDENGADIPNPLVAGGETTGNKREPTSGGYNVREGYAEVSVVPVVGRPGAEWVELRGALRGFNYNTFGSDFTWKTDALWRFGEGVSVRGTYSTAFRAPSIGELYSGTADSFPAVTDPCDTGMGDRTDNAQMNCSADGLPDNYADDRTQIRSLVGGNTELDPETANIFTMGTVYEPTFLPNLSLTLDYFNIAIDNAIQALGSGLILSSCYDAPPDQRKYCELIERDPNTGFINIINDTSTNVGGVETAGVDFNVRYNQNTAVGAFRFNVEGTWLQKYNSIEPDGTTIVGKKLYDLGVFPAWRWNFGTLWGMDEWGAGFNARYIGAIRECQNDDCKVGTKANGERRRIRDPNHPDFEPPPPTRWVSPNITADLFGNYTLETPVGTSRLTLGVNNILDQKPSVIYNGFLGTSDASTYDFLGRYFYARFVQQF